MNAKNRDLIVALLTELGACDRDDNDALPWARSLPANTTPESAWNACERGDWLVWMLGELHNRGAITRQTLVLAACAAARTALVHLKGRESEAATVAPIKTAERWTRGEATLDEVIASRDAAWDARRTESASAATAYYADAAAAATATASADAIAQRRAEIAAAVRAVVPWQTVAAVLRSLFMESGFDD